MRAERSVRLGRGTWDAAPPDPVRVVHLGPGAFFRAHPAWCTAAAGDGWGIAAVGRSEASIAALAEQDGLYGVLVRGPDGDRARVVGSVSATATTAELGALVAEPAVTVATLTVTEAAYVPGSPVIGALAAALSGRHGVPIAVVACDNLAGGGPLLRSLLVEARPQLEGAFDAGTLTCPSCVVDRITPASTPEDRAAVADLLGVEDLAAVVTEPDLEWVVEDAFPGGRPAWERAGARLVDDVGPFSARKLRLLNAGHSLLAYAGGAAGHRFVHEAAGDAGLRGAVERLWAEARRWMAPADAAVADRRYLDGVLSRWANARLPHALEQIGAEGATKLAQRVTPTLLAATAVGASCPATAGVVGAWVAHVRGATPWPVRDARAAEVAVVAAGTTTDGARSALALLDRRLSADAPLVAAVATSAEEVAAQAGRSR